jgi:hypothetical protein
MYPSDYAYTYAYGVDSTCYSDPYDCSVGIPTAGWLFNSNDQWTISPSSSFALSVFIVDFTGEVYYSSATDSYSVRPVVYLKSDINLRGTGASSDHYQIIA